MPEPMHQNEEIDAAAWELQRQGKLTIRKLREYLGGGDQTRIVAGYRRVKDAAKAAPSSQPSPEVRTELSFSPETQRLMKQLEVLICRDVDAARRTERGTAERELAEVRSDHAAQVARLEETIDELHDGLATLAEELEGGKKAVDALRSDLARERQDRERERGEAKQDRERLLASRESDRAAFDARLRAANDDLKSALEKGAAERARADAAEREVTVTRQLVQSREREVERLERRAAEAEQRALDAQSDANEQRRRAAVADAKLEQAQHMLELTEMPSSRGAASHAPEARPAKRRAAPQRSRGGEE